MPTAPGITLTATLEDFTGVAAGSTANPAKLRISLCGFGPVLPRIAGTAMLARVGPFDIFSTGSALTTALFGNDQITPAGTYYSIEILDGNDNVAQCGAYQFTGTATVDLSNAPQLTLPAGVLTVEAGVGALPGNGFTFSFPAFAGAFIALYYRGVFQRPGIDYTVTGSQVTMSYQLNEAPFGVYISNGPPTPPFPIVEIPAGAIPGQVYSLNHVPAANQLIGLFYNGIFQRPGIDYILTANNITLNFVTRAGSNLYACYVSS